MNYSDIQEAHKAAILARDLRVLSKVNGLSLVHERVNWRSSIQSRFWPYNISDTLNELNTPLV
jgi:hypothetical protein